MRRKFSIAKPFFLIIVVSVFTYSCSCNCGKNTDGNNTVKGYITVVDNEPFAKLAINTDDNKIYLLQCSKELSDQLWKQQGTYYYVTYTELRELEGIKTLVVEKVIPLTKDDK